MTKDHAMDYGPIYENLDRILKILLFFNLKIRYFKTYF